MAGIVLAVLADMRTNTRYLVHLAFVALVFVLGLGPSQAQVCGDSTCSSGESCTNCALDCAAWLGCNVNASQVVTVDFAVDAGPATQRASGFIGADFTNTDPPDSRFLPLKPRLLSWQTGYGALNRAVSAGVRYELKLWNKSLIPSSSTGDWSRWDDYVRSRVRNANGEDLVSFDIWNEPEFATYWDGAIDGRYFEMWRRTHDIIRTESPMALIVGPSTTNLSWMKNTFLPTVRSMNALPDVLSWHEMDNGANVLANVQSVRTFLQSNGFAIDKISINEFMGPTYARKPGVAVRFFAQLEAAQVFTAAKACWEEVAGGYYECVPHFDNVLTPNRDPRGIWWTYRSYADLTGRLVRVAGTSSVTGLAAQNPSTATARVLVGSMASVGPLELRLVNLDRLPFLFGQNLRVVLNRIPNTESNPLPSPIEDINLEYLIQSNTVRIILENLPAYDAVEVRLSESSAETPVDADGDGHATPDDCDDGDATIYPDAPELPSDRTDNDCDGQIDETNHGPTGVSLSTSPSSGTAPLAVTLACTGQDADGDALSYRFEFGDGQSASGGSVVSHTYTAPGVFAARCSVDDGFGHVVQSAPMSITVDSSTPTNQAPTIESLVVSPTSGTAPLVVGFDARAVDAEGDPVMLDWDFGDGQRLTSVTESTVSHTYDRGRFRACLTARDTVGGSTTQCVSIKVNRPSSGGGRPGRESTEIRRH